MAKLHARISKGLNLLEQKFDFAENHHVDFNAIKACGMLAKCLSGWVVKMQAVKSDSDALVELKSFVLFMKETLHVQSDVWRAARFIEDDNYNWWFEEPFNYVK